MISLKKINRVDQDPDLHWCPRPDWGKYVEIDENMPGRKRKAVCSWGYKFCIGCYEPWHKNKSWDQVRDKGMRDLEKKKKLKKCPEWQSPIEKNGGCNSMTCRTWGYFFDWVKKSQKRPRRRPYRSWYDKPGCLGLFMDIVLVFLLAAWWPFVWGCNFANAKREMRFTWRRLIIAIFFCWIIIPLLIISILIFLVLLIISFIFYLIEG